MVAVVVVLAAVLYQPTNQPTCVRARPPAHARARGMVRGGVDLDLGPALVAASGLLLWAAGAFVLSSDQERAERENAEERRKHAAPAPQQETEGDAVLAALDWTPAPATVFRLLQDDEDEGDGLAEEDTEFLDLRASARGENGVGVNRVMTTQDSASGIEDPLIPRVAGLKNLGNTCFMNAVLQSLASSPVFIQFMQEHAVAPSQDFDAARFTAALWETLSQLRFVKYGSAILNEQGLERSMLGATSALDSSGTPGSGQRTARASSEPTTASYSYFSIFGGGSSAAHSAATSHVLDPSELEARLRQLGPAFARAGMQQDADELFHLLLDSVEEATLKRKHGSHAMNGSHRAASYASLGLAVTEAASRPRPGAAYGEASGLGAPPRAALLGRQPRREHSLLDLTASVDDLEASSFHTARAVQPTKLPLEGTLMSQLVCFTCGRRSPLHGSPFTVLPLSIVYQPTAHAHHRGENNSGDASVAMNVSKSLQESLRVFTSPEIVEDVACEQCKQRGKARKRIMLGRLPKVLCVHLQRKHYEPRYGNMIKVDSFVKFPEQLNVQEFCFFSVLGREEEAWRWARDAAAGKAPSWRHSASTSRLQPSSVHLNGSGRRKNSAPGSTPSSPVVAGQQLGLSSRAAGSPEGGRPLSSSVSMSVSPVFGALGFGVGTSPLQSSGPLNGSLQSPPFLSLDRSTRDSPGLTPPTRWSSKKSLSNLESSLNLSASNNIRGLGGRRALSRNSSSMLHSHPSLVGEDAGRLGDRSQYELTAVIVHHGSAYGGHFTAYRRVLLPDGAGVQWLHASDSNVRPCSVDEVMQARAYMCFYERV